MPDPIDVVSMSGLVTSENVEFVLKSPYSDCPFMKYSAFHPGVAKSIPKYTEDIRTGNFAHTCHKTDPRPQCDGPVRGQDRSQPVQNCVGSILMLMRIDDAAGDKRGKSYWMQRAIIKAIYSGKLSGERLRELMEEARSNPGHFQGRRIVGFLRSLG